MAGPVATTNAPEDESATGDVLAGRYELQSLIGTGGMGAVYQGLDRQNGRQVAIKRLRKDRLGDELLARRLLREAENASKIGHPAIVEVLATGSDENDHFFLVLELLEGEDLSAAIRGGTLTLGELWRITIEVLDALAAAHDAGIVHRDIKPENVFLVGQGLQRRVKLLDFGIAKQQDAGSTDTRLTTTGVVMGTPHYMSPEQARGSAVDGRSDLWAVGTMLFRALTGRMPFIEENYNVLMARMLTEEPPRIDALRPGLPSALRSAVDGSLRSRPEARFASAAQMRDAMLAGMPLADALSGSDAPAWADAPASPDDPLSITDPQRHSTIGSRRPASRKLPIWLAVAAVVASAGGFFAVRGLRSHLAADPAGNPEVSHPPAGEGESSSGANTGEHPGATLGAEHGPDAQDDELSPEEVSTQPVAEGATEQANPTPTAMGSRRPGMLAATNGSRPTAMHASPMGISAQTSGMAPNRDAPPETQPSMTSQTMGDRRYEIARDYD